MNDIRWAGWTINATPTEILQENGQRATIPTDTAYRFSGSAIAREAATGTVQEWSFTALVNNIAGVLSFGSAPLISETTPGAWTLDFTASTPYAALIPMFTGEAGKTISIGIASAITTLGTIYIPPITGAPGTVAAVCQDWCGGNPQRMSVYVEEPGVMARWISQAQSRFADKAECLRGVWTPTVPSTGIVALPANFGREIKDGIRWGSSDRLTQVNYTEANMATFSSTRYYSIWGSNFYVFSAAAGTLSIPYIKKPAEITVGTLSTADLEIPTDYHRDLFNYLDAMFVRRSGDFASSTALMKEFDDSANNARLDYAQKTDPVPRVRSGMF